MASGAAAPLQPTFTGFIGDIWDACILLQACQEGRLNHIGRRPHDKERERVVVSGSVFVYEEHSSGIKRWTDGKSWSPSRILTPFLVYRQLDRAFPPGEKKRAMKKDRTAPYSNRGAGSPPLQTDSLRWIRGSLQDSYKFKQDGGLIKKTFSLKVNGVTHHIVGYYSIDDVLNFRLKPPSRIPTLNDLIPSQAIVDAIPTGNNGVSLLGEDFFNDADEEQKKHYCSPNRYWRWQEELAHANELLRAQQQQFQQQAPAQEHLAYPYQSVYDAAGPQAQAFDQYMGPSPSLWTPEQDAFPQQAAASAAFANAPYQDAFVPVEPFHAQAEAFRPQPDAYYPEPDAYHAEAAAYAHLGYRTYYPPGPGPEPTRGH